MQKNKLTGNVQIDINAAPKPKTQEKLGLVEEGNSQIKSFNLSYSHIYQLDMMTERLSKEAGKKFSMDNFKFSQSKVIQLLINYAENKSLDELLTK